MIPLYEIQAALLPLIKKLDETEDSLEYELLVNEIEKIEIDKTQKLDGCAAYIKQMRAESEIIHNEIVKLKDREDSINRKIEKFLDYIKMCLPNQEIHKSPLHSISWRKSERAEPVDIAKIPIQYLREKLSYDPDRAQALKDMKMGATIPGFELVTRNNIQVK